MFSSLHPMCRGTKQPLNERTVEARPAASTFRMAPRS